MMKKKTDEIQADLINGWYSWWTPYIPIEPSLAFIIQACQKTKINPSYACLEVPEMTIMGSAPRFLKFCLLDSEIKKSEESWTQILDSSRRY